MVTAEEVASRYPLHWLVWNNQHEELTNQLQGDKFTVEDIELKDPRGRTPLLLAVTLGHLESVQALLDAGADVNCEKDGWTAVQEATVTGDPELLSLVLSRRDQQRHTVRSAGIPELLDKLSLAPDFYVEMKWEFTSWVPLVSRMCPSDTYKVYKRGANVRVDTTLVGFDNNKWQRGNRTYIFRGAGSSASLVELDHELGTTWCEYLEPPSNDLEMPTTSHKALMMRLNSPIATTRLDTDNISIERNKSGIWGWRQDKIESVNGHDCKVFSANNVELVSATRTEHLTRERKRAASPRAPLAGLLALADTEVTETTLLRPDNDNSSEGSRSTENLSVEPLSWQQYFGDGPLSRDVGRPREVTTKVQKFRATLCLCEDYPLQLQEQIMPILDLMAAMSSPHFAKLKDFIQLQLPAGFPVKIEIPLFHVLNARITFGNIFATDSPVDNVRTIDEGDRLSCVIDDACFDIGSDYRDTTEPEDRHLGVDDEEGLLQYAIQQSLMDPGTHDDQVDVWEALRGAPPASPAPLAPTEDTQLQRAIEASLANLSVHEDCLDPELVAALDLSAKEQARRDEQAMLEQKQLQDVLWLSLLDK